MQDILDFFSNNNEVGWFILGAILILSEVMLITGIGFFFAALGAILVGALLTFDLMSNNFIIQCSFFFLFTAGWTAILWKPLKNWGRSKDSYDNIIGTHAFAHGTIEKGKSGKVKWSGASMRAQISADSEAEKLENGQEVWVHAVKGSILIIDNKQP